MQNTLNTLNSAYSNIFRFPLNSTCCYYYSYQIICLMESFQKWILKDNQQNESKYVIDMKYFLKIFVISLFIALSCIFKN